MKHARVTNIPKNPKILWEDAIKIADKHWVDEKGTPNHPSVWKRELSHLTFEEAFDLIQPYKPHWVILYRNQEYLTGIPEENYWEFGGCNIASNGYGDVFIWIQVKPKDAEELFKKYGLKVEWY
jgi:hypothetical protein